MANVPVDFGVLEIHHHSWRDVRAKVPGLPEGETCCFKMSHALNKSGAIVKPMRGAVDYIVNGLDYYSRVSTMREYLDQEYDDAENYVGGERIAKIAQIIDRTGILAFGNRHIDLWDRTNIHRPSDYILSALWQDPSTLKLGIFFWEVTPP